MQPFIYYSGCTTNPGIHRDGLDRAVCGTGATLHASVAVGEQYLFPGSCEHLMRTGLQTTAATDAGVLVEAQRYHIFEIAKASHFTPALLVDKIFITVDQAATPGSPGS